MPRLFVAIDLPAGIKLALAPLCAGPRRVRWVKPGSFHLTLRFIGEVDDELADRIAAALTSIAAASFSLDLAGVGHFGGHTLWAGVTDCAELMQLQSEIEGALQRLGLPPETQVYKPHVKLGRLSVRSWGPLHKFLKDRALFHAGPFKVERFSLMAIQLMPGGPMYEHRADYPLALPIAETF